MEYHFLYFTISLLTVMGGALRCGLSYLGIQMVLQDWSKTTPMMRLELVIYLVPIHSKPTTDGFPVVQMV
jgi:hypothetical protein